MYEKSSNISPINKCMSLSLEDACSNSLEVLEKSKGVYESMKILKKDIEIHERKKKTLEMQIERLRASFIEYVQSIETIEKSEIYTRAHPSKRLNHSRILKYSHLYMPPPITSVNAIDGSLVSIIKKACAEYKLAKARYESLSALEKTGTALTSQAKVEWKFQVYEKKINFAQSKMSFSIQTNKLTLCLLKAISCEVEEIQKVSIDHANLCLSLEKIKNFQYNSSENAISSLISDELSTLTDLAENELERQKRKIANENRPQSEEKARAGKKNQITRKLIPCKTGFLVSDFKEEFLFSFFGNFINNGHVFRGVFSFFKNTLIVDEMVFGWKYSIQRSEIFFFSPDKGSVSIDTQSISMVISCDSDYIKRFCNWYNGSMHTDREILLIGRTDRPCEEVFESIFKPETEEYKERIKKAGYELLESSTEENRIRKRVFLKNVRQKLLFFQVIYSETYTIDESKKTNSSIIIHSEIKLSRLLPNIIAVSKLYLKSEEDTTAIYYCYEKSLNSFLLVPFSKVIMRRVITKLHLFGLSDDISLYQLPGGLLNFLSINLIMGIVAVAAVSSGFSKMLFAILNIY